MNKFDRVEKATVKIINKGGQGVVIPGGFILTAAHCITWKDDGRHVLGYDVIEVIKAGRRTLKATPRAVEPVCDIAVLGAVDEQRFERDAKVFEDICQAVEPVPLCETEYPLRKPFRVRIWTHKRKWIHGKAQLWCPAANTVHIEADKQVEGGTSGGPIVNERGELVGIVSNSNVGPSMGGAPRPHRTLPVWVMDQIHLAGSSAPK